MVVVLCDVDPSSTEKTFLRTGFYILILDIGSGSELVSHI
jgi:hypothetical protein